MLQARGDQRLALKARDLIGRRLQQLLERDGATEPAILGGDDAAHAAARDLAIGRVVLGRHRRESGGIVWPSTGGFEGATTVCSTPNGTRLPSETVIEPLSLASTGGE